MNKIDLQQIRMLVRAAIKIAVKCGMAKCHLQEIVSTEFDTERNNVRSPQ